MLSCKVKGKAGGTPRLTYKVDGAAKWHQEGTSKMVARPILPVGDIPPAHLSILDKNLSNSSL